MGSTEDLLSDSASITSDVSDTSLNNSLTGKRSIPPPFKVLYISCYPYTKHTLFFFLLIDSLFQVFCCWPFYLLKFSAFGFTSWNDSFCLSLPSEDRPQSRVKGQSRVLSLRLPGWWTEGETRPPPIPQCPASIPVLLALPCPKVPCLPCILLFISVTPINSHFHSDFLDFLYCTQLKLNWPIWGGHF